MVTNMSDLEAMVEVLKELEVGTYLIMVRKVDEMVARNSIIRKKAQNTWIEGRLNGPETIVRGYTDLAIAKGILNGWHHWAFS